ncbi:MAG TPA: glutamate--tRNA ligase [Nitrososphaeraceae archaeon]|nr:glutamate--tRNA ligase [Nitrososphaeraceae archaeon]
MEFDDDTFNKIKIIILKNAVEYQDARLDVVISKIIAMDPDFIKEIKKIIPKIKEEIDNINELPKKNQIELLKEMDPTYGHKKRDSKDKKEFNLPRLNNAIEGFVVTRFPPEPNGYPHIGHAKAAIIDEEYARHYKGKFILRFDDTNPLNEKIEYYDAILEGIKWLKINPDIIKNTSDDINLLHKYGKEIIKSDGAYICTCRQETIHKLRANGIQCKCRKDLSITLENMEKIFDGYFHTNDAIIRFKGDMSGKNTAMRDPTLFRIIEKEHPKLGNKIFLWPTYDFAAPIEDSLDGVTHAFRTKEYELRNELYRKILKILKLRVPEVIEFSRLEFEGLPVSKRKIKPLIENSVIKGWDDPRLPTLIAFKKRGFTPEAIRQFVLSLGLTLSETKPSMEILESFNRKIIEHESKRLFFVNEPFKITLKNCPPLDVKIKNHPSLNMGTRNVSVKDIIYISSVDARKLNIESELRLIELYNIVIKKINFEEKEALAEYSGKILRSDIPKIQWVSNEGFVEYKIIKPNVLFINEKFNPDSLKILHGFAESFVSTLSKDTRIQFIREGFCRIEDSNTSIFTHK